MKILFLVYHGFSEVSGISKKIRYQVKGLKECGHDVRLCYYDFSADGHRCRYIDGRVLKDYGMGKWAALRQRFDYNSILDYCLSEGIEFVYARSFQNANPLLINFFSQLKRHGIKAVTEIPTYPYDGEFAGATLKNKVGLFIDRLFRNRLSAQMEAMVTFSDAKTIFGQRTINISNGVDFDSIPLHRPAASCGSDLHIIGVAEVHFWHGFDRMIAGLGEYYGYSQSPGCSPCENSGNSLSSETIHSSSLPSKRNIVFHIVGGIWSGDLVDNKHAPGIQTLIDKYRLQDHVVLHGQLFGEELDKVFNQCQFAVGSLGRHRSGITVIKTLKNREYATRGIPFIYSETDSDFDFQPYVIKAPADESPVDVESILRFADGCSLPPADIRKTVEHLTWQKQMQKVVAEVFS